MCNTEWFVSHALILAAQSIDFVDSQQLDAHLLSRYFRDYRAWPISTISDEIHDLGVIEKKPSPFSPAFDFREIL